MILCFSRSLEEILEVTLDLLASHLNSSSSPDGAVMSPLHLFALIDPKATWFVKFMVSIY